MIDDSTCVMQPKDDDIYMCYTCATNKKRNVIATTILSTYVDETYPIVKPGDNDQSVCDGIPRHTLVLESLIESKEGARIKAFHNYVIDNNGDADIKQVTSRHTDPTLKLYSGIPLMITANKDIKREIK